MYILYSFLYTLAIIFLLPFEYFKRPKDLRQRWIREKCGVFNSSLISRFSPLIWVHAVSVGEVMAALPLINKLREKEPSRGIILSTITDTGQKVAHERTTEDVMRLYLPFDISFILNRVVKRLRPEILLVMETELWPNMFKVFKENGIPIVVLNGRISEKSLKGYKRISFFMNSVLSSVDLFAMQDEVSTERILRLGVNSKKVMKLGNLKFDTKPPAQIPAWTEKIKGPVITAGSTHQGEEELFISVYIEIKKEFPDINLIIAPRHPERFKEVENILSSKEISCIKRSTINSHQISNSLSGMVILLDSVGELSAVYGKSDIAIIGKSFKGFGGQNPLEPAYWGKPILCGPHMENFPIIQDFYREGAALQVHEDDLSSSVRNLLMSPEKAEEIGTKAQKLYRRNTGAVEKAMEIITQYISK